MNNNLKHFIILFIIILLGSLMVGTMGYFMEDIYPWILYVLISFGLFSGVAVMFFAVISLITWLEDIL